MKLGVDEPAKLIILGALVLIGGYLKFSDVFSGSSVPSTPATPQKVARTRQTATSDTAPVPRPAPRARSRVQSDDFHPVLRSKRPEEQIDPATVDPTLRLDLLAKVQQAELSGPGRNVFQFGQAPPKPLPPEPKVPLAKPVVAAAPKPSSTPPAGPPPPPPINLRYYGFTSVPGTPSKTAFFLDGEEILVAKEGETVKRRYRVVRIGATSVVMEDTESKRQQTLPLAEEVAG